MKYRPQKAKLEQSGEPAYRVLIDMLSAMVPPTRDADVFDMAANDSSSDTTFTDAGDSGAEGGGMHGQRETARLADQMLVQIDLEQAKQRLDMHLRGRSVAVDNAKAAGRRKRLRGDAGEKLQDWDEDEKMVLTVAQVEGLFEERIKEARGEAHRLESMLLECIPVPPPATPQQQPQTHHRDSPRDTIAASSGHNGGPCPTPVLQPTACADTPPPPRAMGGRAIAARLEASTVTAEMADARAAASDIERRIAEEMEALAANTEAKKKVIEANNQIIQQNAEQATLDAEVAAMRLAIHGFPLQPGGYAAQLMAAPAVAHVASPLAVFGPTGASLAEQQLSMRRATAQGAAAEQPTAPRASCRWARAAQEGGDEE